jgi:hypothetical protein
MLLFFSGEVGCREKRRAAPRRAHSTNPAAHHNHAHAPQRASLRARPRTGRTHARHYLLRSARGPGRHRVRRGLICSRQQRAPLLPKSATTRPSGGPPPPPPPPNPVVAGLPGMATMAPFNMTVVNCPSQVRVFFLFFDEPSPFVPRRAAALSHAAVPPHTPTGPGQDQPGFCVGGRAGRGARLPAGQWLVRVFFFVVFLFSIARPPHARALDNRPALPSPPFQKKTSTASSPSRPPPAWRPAPWPSTPSSAGPPASPRATPWPPPPSPSRRVGGRSRPC